MSVEVKTLINHYHSQSSIRDPKLFSHFLVPGYEMTTLNSVPKLNKEKVLIAKLNLGLFITLIDDLADNPQFFNPNLLQLMYQLLPGKIPLSPPPMLKTDNLTYQLGKRLIFNLNGNICHLPNYSELKEILQFDIEQIYRANRYCELLSAHPTIANLKESQEYGPYNMGMVAAGMIDLMGTDNFEMKELGNARECFLMGQRMGRIGNLIATYSREKREKDITNEIIISNRSYHEYSKYLLKEFNDLKKKIKGMMVSSFSTDYYAESMEKFFNLHFKLIGHI